MSKPTDVFGNPTNEIVIGEGIELVQIGPNKYEARIKTNIPVVDPLPPVPQPPTPIQATSEGTLDVQNFTTAISDSQIQTWMAAVDTQVNRDVGPVWKKSLKMNFIPKGQLPTAGNGQCGFFDNTDTPGAAAWHDLGPNGEPLAKIFVNEAPPSVSFSHEIIETISDWNANTTTPGVDSTGKPFITFVEACDAVESNTYQINGIDVSDFVTPAWFNLEKGGDMDFLKITTKPFELASGGYTQLSYDNGQTWNTINKASNRAHMHDSPHSRWAIYKKKPEDRVKSTFAMKPKEA